MRAQDVIMTKRDRGRLSDAQIDWFISNYAAGTEIADEQAAALVMAIFLNGMSPEELARWTGAMIDSGSRLDLSMLDRPTVDKHSTGGVGDKLSLIVVPLLAACGAAVPQLSGRGLGHTGGTLDKMEAIPGWRAELSLDDMRRQLDTVGGVIAGASASLAPADRKLYALRDVTATVESIPLIASSIMSKKIAEGTGALTLDVKVGSGAFMKEFRDADALARVMVELGEAHGVATSALVTRMDDLLGRTAGNALEVEEAIDVLSGGGPADVVEVSLALANDMVRLVGLDNRPGDRVGLGGRVRDVRGDGGGPGRRPVAGPPDGRRAAARQRPRGGIVQRVDAMSVGMAAWHLGAGRARKEDPVSATAGVRSLVAKGDAIEAGQPMLELHADDPGRFDLADPYLATAVAIDDDQPEPSSLIIESVTTA